MSQIEILNFLERNKNNWYFASYICYECKLLPCNGMKSLKKLREYEEIKYKRIEGIKNERFMYKYKKVDDII